MTNEIELLKKIEELKLLLDSYSSKKYIPKGSDRPYHLFNNEERPTQILLALTEDIQIHLLCNGSVGIKFTGTDHEEVWQHHARYHQWEFDDSFGNNK